MYVCVCGYLCTYVCLRMRVCIIAFFFWGGFGKATKSPRSSTGPLALLKLSWRMNISGLITYLASWFV